MPALDQVIFQAMLYFGGPIALLVGVCLWLSAKAARAILTPPQP